MTAITISLSVCEKLKTGLLVLMTNEVTGLYKYRFTNPLLTDLVKSKLI